MVAHRRDLVNIFSLYSTNFQNKQQKHIPALQMNIEYNNFRDWSKSSSTNSFREPFVHSDISSINYVDRVQNLANNPTQTKQINNKKLQSSFLSYEIAKERMDDSTNTKLITNSMHSPYSSQINNMSMFQDIEPSVILYRVNQPVDLQLQNGSFCPISLFRINEYLEDDVKNITCSLFRKTSFIKQRRLEDKIAKDISQISKFGYIVWEFLSAIYKAEQDKLTADKNNILVQFNRSPLSNIPSKKQTKRKQANISRISPFILLRPNKSILKKSKFFKIDQDSKSKPLSNVKLQYLRVI